MVQIYRQVMRKRENGKNRKKTVYSAVVFWHDSIVPNKYTECSAMTENNKIKS